MRLLRAFLFWLQIAGGTVVVVALGWLGTQWALHLKLLSVQTGSMQPTFRPGDALILQRSNVHAPGVGEIVSYHSARNPNELVTHRVVSVAATSFQTKGDALAGRDPVVRNSLLVGRVVAILPGMGRLLNALETLPGLIICIYIPAAAVAISELVRLERHYRSRSTYRLRSRSGMMNA